MYVCVHVRVLEPVCLCLEGLLSELEPLTVCRAGPLRPPLQTWKSLPACLPVSMPPRRSTYQHLYLLQQFAPHSSLSSLWYDDTDGGTGPSPQ